MPLQIVRNDITKMKVDAIGGAIRHIGNVHKYARPSGFYCATRNSNLLPGMYSEMA